MFTNSLIDIVHHKPNKLLSKYIRKIAVFKSNGAINYQQKLTPTASMYFTYHHEDVPKNIINNITVNPDFRLQIDGPKIYKETFIDYNGKLNRVMFEFSASGFYYLFHQSPVECIDQLFKLKKFTNESIQTLDQDLQSLKNSKEQIQILEKFLIEMSYKSLPFCDYVEDAIRIIDSNHGSISMNKITENIRVSERQLCRQFTKIVGISPKHYSKIVQLHYIINLMKLKEYTSLQDIAQSAEFYDLSHFTSVFKELTGFSPLEFIHSEKHIALKYFDDLIE